MRSRANGDPAPKRNSRNTPIENEFDPVVRYCAETLEEAVGPDAAAAIFAVDPLAGVQVFCATSGAADSTTVAALETVALDSLRTRRPVRLDEAAGAARHLGNSVLALPAVLGDEIVALVVLTAPLTSLVARAEAVRPHLLPLALGVDRNRTLRALNRRGDEVGAIRQQLDAYAVDFRSTYRAERDRAQQLANALEELEETYLATVQGLAIAVEAKDECTGGHLQRVSRYGMVLTGIVAPDHAHDAQFEYGFLLHDVGKLTVPDFVLQKPGALTDEEWTQIREHPTSGRSILSGIPFLHGAREIVYAHHERWDGRGYPRGLSGTEIPLGAQIFPLCDAFDAMTSDRPYRPALSTSDALAEIRLGSGSQFWPTAVDAFLDLPTSVIEEIRMTTPSGTSASASLPPSAP